MASVKSMIKDLTADEWSKLPWLHVYPQRHAHHPAEIRGTREALVALREAIDLALDRPNGAADAVAFARDGEGYSIEVRRVPRDALHRSRLPYRW